MRSSHLAGAIRAGFLQEVVLEADSKEFVGLERGKEGKCEEGRRHKLYGALQWPGTIRGRF